MCGCPSLSVAGSHFTAIRKQLADARAHVMQDSAAVDAAPSSNSAGSGDGGGGTTTEVTANRALSARLTARLLSGASAAASGGLHSNLSIAGKIIEEEQIGDGDESGIESGPSTATTERKHRVSVRDDSVHTASHRGRAEGSAQRAAASPAEAARVREPLPVVHKLDTA